MHSGTNSETVTPSTTAELLRCDGGRGVREATKRGGKAEGESEREREKQRETMIV